MIDIAHADENVVLAALAAEVPVSRELRKRASERATELVRAIRGDSAPGLMEVFLAEYGLSTDEGVALMCLAEALLRVPDAPTMDALIEDKIAPSTWGIHLGRSSSSLVNASTWALMLTGKVLQGQNGDGVAAQLHGAVKRLGEPVIRRAVNRAMQELGHQFVLGRDIAEAIRRGGKLARQGFTFSYDMLGEAALTDADARRYFDAYSAAIRQLAQHCDATDVRENPGISVKLSALHPRYEVGQKGRVMRELVPAARTLARMARKAGMGFNIDAEEADRLDLSLDVIEAVLRDPDLAGWDGFGVVVQAYGKRAGAVLDWLNALAQDLDRKIMVRLVKGAYWDTEIKRAQVEGLDGFPVFTHKVASDASYIYCAKKVLGMQGRIYPQFATHNAHTVAAILELAETSGQGTKGFEFQRLQGMGEALHAIVHKTARTRCRIYAPVGTHRDLLAYLVRRLLENGANSSFVNQIVNEDVPPEIVAADPFAALEKLGGQPNPHVLAPATIFGPMRKNSHGDDLHDTRDIVRIDAAREPFRAQSWQGRPVLACDSIGGEVHIVRNPAKPEDIVGEVVFASDADAEAALVSARTWDDKGATARANVLCRAADLYEENAGQLYALLTREAGKTPKDAISEIREAVDFLRYYAVEAQRHDSEEPCGIFTCISPWNFPLAIFTGQIAAALAVGNGVLAKPAESTSLIATFAVSLLHKAGVPRAVLQLVPGRGGKIGAALTSDARVGGVCFTGSTATAQQINRAMANGLAPSAPLIAETGGLNAMIVDSSALPEQAVKDIVMSAFQSAGQRCSALRMLYVQEDIADRLLEMLFGAMDELVLGDPWDYATDVGPVIDKTARDAITGYIDAARREGRLLKRLATPQTGWFVPPAALRVNGIADLEREVFGPVLHLATFAAGDLDQVIDDINATGYGLTFGMHSRIDDRVDQVTARLKVGNIYINRNQIGAVVGSQPFGGEGLSGTGPKAGGPAYLPRFLRPKTITTPDAAEVAADVAAVAKWLDALAGWQGVMLERTVLPGVTGESNQLSVYGRGVVLCLGPTLAEARAQAKVAAANGCQAVIVAPQASEAEGVAGRLDRCALATLPDFAVVALWSDPADQRAARQALSERAGPIIALSSGADLAERCRLERHICIDTTAAGGNTRLLSAS